MTDTDRPDLDAIAGRANAATPGPWEPLPDYGPNWIGVEWAGYVQTVGDLVFGEGDDADADREFVIHAREDMDTLLSEVDRLKTELEDAEHGAQRALAQLLESRDLRKQASDCITALKRELEAARREERERCAAEADRAAEWSRLESIGDRIRALPDEDTPEET